MRLNRFKRWLSSLPVHVVLIGLCLVWLLPTLGLLVTSFRPFQVVKDTGWWEVLTPKGQAPYQQTCAACHGDDGRKLAAADLAQSDLITKVTPSYILLAVLKEPINGQPHTGALPVPDAQTVADILAHLRRLSGIDTSPTFTFSNYRDALIGYTRAPTTYEQDCAAGTQPLDMYCDARDLLNPRGMGRAFLNSLIVAIPSTFLPVLFAAFAAYAFSWMHFRGRMGLLALLVGLQIAPIQIALIPILKMYVQLGLNGTFLSVWLFHTGFGLPYAIYLMRNFLGSLPREVFESAYLDGASHWTAFRKIAIPLSVPAIASLSIFQFLWIWNDYLVALIFLGGKNPVLTYQITNLAGAYGGSWNLLTAAAFISMALPLIVFFALQRYFVRGLLAGSVKG